MRISDWSSDVCSSDLDRRAFGNRDAVGALIESLGLAAGRQRLGLGKGREAVDRLRGVEAAGQHHRAGAGLECGHCHADRGQRRGAGRSEEHTAEHKSLMGMWDAGLWKKKKMER